mgnify:CR=1 FL=1
MIEHNGPDIPGYRIERELGRGGMATVYLAVQESLQRRVALKVMKAALAADEEFAERFVREARTAAGLQHASIVSIHDAGQTGHHSYLAMEFVSGGELKDRLREGGMPSAEAMVVLRQIAAGLDYAHGKGFVHRDVKPENILFRDDGTAVLSDFGIARAVDSSTRMTATGLSIGTPHYMSPEQARGRELDGRSDLYALGVLFYEMLTGQVPFDAQDSFAVSYKHINDPLPQLPPALAKFQPILDRLLAKDPGDRYQSGAELIADLDRIEQGQKLDRGSWSRGSRENRIRKADQKSRSGNHGFTDHGKSGIADRAASQSGSRRALAWGLGGAALAALLGIGIYLWQDPQNSPTSLGGGASTVSRPAAQPVQSPTREMDTPDRSADASPTSDHRPPTTAPTGAAILNIETTPKGAEVFLNDQRLGTTPFQSDELPAGEHRLRIESRYYEPWEQAVRLEKDVVERIEAELQRGTGRVTVITDPPGAEVWIDNQPRPEQTPLTISGLTAGEQQLEIRLDRYRTITHTVEILPDDTARLDLALEGGDLYEWDGRWLTGEEVVPLLLEAAEADLAATRLMAPEGDNAWDKYQRVLAIQPGAENAEAGIAQIAARYVELAQSALAEGEPDRAGAFLANAETAGADGDTYEQTRSRLQSAEAERRAAQQRRRLIEGIQTELARLGREVRATGTLNADTVEAIRAFERALERPETGKATEALLASLRQREKWPGPKPGEVFQDCPECPEMVVIPAGSFMMGSPSSEPQRDSDEGPQHRVTIAVFAMAKTEVTFTQWDACVSDGGCSHRPDDRWGRGDQPVMRVSWNDAQEYVRWLSRKTGEEYKLPSESEWEYAARAGTTTRFHTGNCITTDQANFDGDRPASGCPKGRDRSRTVPVVSFPANAFGLHDMHGNVREWVQDCWNDSYRGAPSDGSAWMRGNCGRAVLRGGSWFYFGRGLRSAARNGGPRGTRFYGVGFRPARSL